MTDWAIDALAVFGGLILAAIILGFIIAFLEMRRPPKDEEWP